MVWGIETGDWNSEVRVESLRCGLLGLKDSGVIRVYALWSQNHVLGAEFISPPKCTLLVFKSVKCIHSATKTFKTATAEPHRHSANMGGPLSKYFPLHA